MAEKPPAPAPVKKTPRKSLSDREIEKMLGPAMELKPAPEPAPVPAPTSPPNPESGETEAPAPPTRTLREEYAELEELANQNAPCNFQAGQDERHHLRVTHGGLFFTQHGGSDRYHWAEKSDAFLDEHKHLLLEATQTLRGLKG